MIQKKNKQDHSEEYGIHPRHTITQRSIKKYAPIISSSLRLIPHNGCAIGSPVGH